MKTAKLFSLLLGLAAVTFVACGPDDTTPVNPTLSIQDAKGVLLTKLDFTTEAGTATFNIVSNVEWTVTEEADWITIDPISGKGNGAVTVTVTENTITEARTAPVTITIEDKSLTVNVNQMAAEVAYVYATATYSAYYDEEDDSWVESSWSVNIYDNEDPDEATTMFSFRLFVDEDTDPEDGVPTGEYLINYDEAVDTVYGGVTTWGDTRNDVFCEEGTLTISCDEEGNYTFVAASRLHDGSNWSMSFTGSVEIVEEKIEYTPVDWTLTNASAMYLGIENEVATWIVTLSDDAFVTSEGASGQMANFTINADASATFDKGLPTGEFAIGEYGVMYMDMATFSMGVMHEGTIKISADGDNYTIAVEGPVGEGTTTIDFTGKVTLTDASSEEGGED